MGIFDDLETRAIEVGYGD